MSEREKYIRQWQTLRLRLRLDSQLYQALQLLPRGRVSQFIRDAIAEKLQRNPSEIGEYKVGFPYTIGVRISPAQMEVLPHVPRKRSRFIRCAIREKLLRR